MEKFKIATEELSKTPADDISIKQIQSWYNNFNQLSEKIDSTIEEIKQNKENDIEWISKIYHHKINILNQNKETLDFLTHHLGFAVNESSVDALNDLIGSEKIYENQTIQALNQSKQVLKRKQRNEIESELLQPPQKRRKLDGMDLIIQ